MDDLVALLKSSASQLKSTTGRGGGRYYLHIPSKQKLQSVTTYLNVVAKPGLDIWKANQIHAAYSTALEDNTNWDTLEQDVKQILARTGGEAARYGNAIHHYIEYEVKYAIDGEIMNFDPDGDMRREFDLDDLRDVGHQFMDWLAERNLTPLLSECPVANLEAGYAGTIDLIARDDRGIIYLIDIKTGKNIYPEHFYQLAAYRRAVLELSDEYAIGCLVAKVRDDEITAYMDDDPDASYVAFSCAVALKDSLAHTNKQIKTAVW